MEKPKQLEASVPSQAGVVGKKTGAVDSNTPSEYGRTGLGKCESTAPNRMTDLADFALSLLPKKHEINKPSNYRFLEKEAIASSREIGCFSICPLCLRTKALSWGRRYSKKTGVKGTRCFRCLNCKRRYSLTRFLYLMTPDYIIDAFFDIISIEPMASLRRISRLIYDKTGKNIAHTTIMYWKQKLRKGKFFDYYYPNSHLNKINKPQINYLPKITVYEAAGHKRTLFYSKNRYSEAVAILSDYCGRIVKADLIRKACKYSRQSHLKDSPLIKNGLIDSLGNGFYYVNDIENPTHHTYRAREPSQGGDDTIPSRWCWGEANKPPKVKGAQQGRSRKWTEHLNATP